MKKILFNWFEAIKYSPINKEGYKTIYPTFITLTLPAKQKHSDKDLYAKGLNYFIEQVKRSHDVTNYLWRAERQVNGNIHYHIIVDKFIGWKLVRSYWNRIIEKLGYIEDYRTNQKNHHKNGFNYSKDLNDKRSYETQYKAYTEGISNNWSNPNSTDIHKVTNIKNLTSYVSKYVSKCPETEKIQEIKKAKECNKINDIEYQIRFKELEAEQDKVRIKGRVWGCSDALKLMEEQKLIITYDEHIFIDKVLADEESKVIKDENFTIIYNNKISDYINKNEYMNGKFKKHHKETFYYLYPKLKPRQKTITQTDFYSISKIVQPLMCNTVQSKQVTLMF